MFPMPRTRNHPKILTSHGNDGCSDRSNVLGGTRTCRFHKALVETDLAISAAASAAYPGDKCGSSQLIDHASGNAPMC